MVDGIKVISKSSSKILSVLHCVYVAEQPIIQKIREGIEQLTLGVLSECGSQNIRKKKKTNLIPSLIPMEAVSQQYNRRSEFSDSELPEESLERKLGYFCGYDS